MKTLTRAAAATRVGTLADDRRALVILGAALAAVTLVLVVDRPSTYAQSHWFFTYSDGLASRSLVGTLFQGVGGDPQRHVAVASYVVFSTAVATLIWAAVRLLGGRSRMGVLVAMVLLFGQTIPHLGSMMGRFDAIVAALGAVAAALVKSRMPGRLVAAGGVLACSVLVHEATLLLVAAWVAAYACHVDTSRQGEPSGRRAAATVLALPVLVALAVMLHTPSVPPATLQAQLFPASFDESMARTASLVHYLGVWDNIAYTAGLVFHRGLLLYYLWAGFLPAALVIVVTVMAFRRSAIGWGDLAATERLMFGVSLTPLLMLPVAHDWDRWAMFAGMSVGATALVVLAPRTSPVPSQRMWVSGALMVIVGWLLRFNY